MENKKEIYCLGFVSCLRPGIWPLSICLFCTILFVPLFAKTNGSDQQVVIWLGLVFILCLVGIPPFILHLNYIMNDKNKCISINNKEETITYFENNSTQKIPISEIIKIKKYYTDLPFSRLSYHTYYYYEIRMKNKESIYLSCMILNKFEKKIAQEKFESIGVFYPLIKKD